MIHIDAKQVDRVRLLLAGMPGEADKAVARALNRGAASVKTETLRGITRNYTVKAVRASAEIKIKNARADNLKATIYITGERLPLSRFRTLPSKAVKRKPKAGVFAQVKKSGGGGRIKSSFIASTKSGHLSVWMRESKRRLPIRKLTSLSVPQMAGNPHVQEEMEDKASAMAMKTLEHELEYRLMRG